MHEISEAHFLKQFPEQKLKILNVEPRLGPDHWPYLFVATGEGADESATNILNWLSARGIGLVVNPEQDTPDFVFTYGMVWNYRERGEFITASPERESGAFRLQPGQEVYTGPVSETVLPGYARSILKQFLLDQGILAPKALMISTDRKTYDLAFSLESLGMPPEQERAGLAEALAWFLPAHYSVVLMSEKTVPGFAVL